MTIARAEVNTGQYNATGDMPIAGHHSFGGAGPSARANFGVSTNGVGGMAQLSAFRMTGEVGFVRGEVNPNLTTGTTIGRNGVETSVCGAGGKITPNSVDIYTPFGSFGTRFPWS